jgi:hypothetical protein
MTLETVIRPFVGTRTEPTPFHPAGATNAPPVRLVIGLVGGNKTFSWSHSTSLSAYMAQVHREKPSDAFDMSTGKLKGA